MPSPNMTSWFSITSVSLLNTEMFTSTFGDTCTIFGNILTYPIYVSEDNTKMPASKEYFYNRKLKELLKFKREDGDIGLEIECEGIDLFATPFKYWVCHDDGSLREVLGYKPLEYVLRRPLKEDEIPLALEYLSTSLSTSKSKVSKSQRTSVHVHVNCQKMTIRELYCYICLYLIFEELLVEYTGPERAGNLFCLRGKDSEFYIRMLESTLKTSSFKDWREDYRYSACNVASIPKFGSLEFRSMKGTIDTGVILDWVKLLCLLRDKSKKYDNPIEIVEDFLAVGPLEFFKKILRSSSCYDTLYKTPELNRKLWDGLRLMRDIAYSCKWETKKKAEEEICNIGINQENAFERGDDYAWPDGSVSSVESVVGGRWEVIDMLGSSSYMTELDNDTEMFYVWKPEYTGDCYLILAERRVNIND